MTDARFLLASPSRSAPPAHRGRAAADRLAVSRFDRDAVWRRRIPSRRRRIGLRHVSSGGRETSAPRPIAQSGSRKAHSAAARSGGHQQCAGAVLRRHAQATGASNSEDVQSIRSKKCTAAMITIGRATGNDSEAAKLVAATREWSRSRCAQNSPSSEAARGADCRSHARNSARSLHCHRRQLSCGAGGIAGGHIAGAAGQEWLREAKSRRICLPSIPISFSTSFTDRRAASPAIRIEAWREMPELKAVRAHRVTA